MDGNELWISDPLEGIAQGDPLISNDGSYVFLTHNEFDQEAGISTGHFTILEANTTGGVFYTGATTDDRAFGPPGIFHVPTEGNYDPIISGSPISEGENNQNDFLMWSQTPKPTDVSVADGFIYGFQFPRDFSGNASNIAFFELSASEIDFQSTTPPVITNEGFSAYWGVSRSSYRGWTNKRFTRARTVSTGFNRNLNFPGEAVFAAPALSNNGSAPIIFGGSATAQFIRMSVDFGSPTVVSTKSLILCKAHVDGQERAVYYVESNGILHQANFETLADIWNFTINFAVEGEMALSPNNDLLLVADRRGIIHALAVAEIPATDSPSEFPSDVPSMAPTVEVETGAPVEAPVIAPSGAPVTTPSDAPVVVPTRSPTHVPTPPVGPPTDNPDSSANQPILILSVVMSFVCLYV